MSATASRIPSRATTLVLLAFAHGLVLWLLWRVQVPLPIEPEAFTSLLFWAPPTDHAGQQCTAHQPRVATTRALRRQITPAPAADSGTAVTVPANPGDTVDWFAALIGAAASELEQEKRAATKLGAVTHRYALPTDTLNPGRPAPSRFRWYDAGIHRIDTRGFIPGLWLNDHCVLIAFVMPACKIGHIEIHGDLFENLAGARDESEATARPNDAP
jgi:hypothetical protein